MTPAVSRRLGAIAIQFNPKTNCARSDNSSRGVGQPLGAFRIIQKVLERVSRQVLGTMKLRSWLGVAAHCRRPVAFTT